MTNSKLIIKAMREATYKAHKTNKTWNAKKEAIKAKLNIFDLIGEDVALEEYKKDEEYIGLCPFHKDTVPTLHVNSSKGVYHCFSCGAGGDGFKYVMERDSVDFKVAFKTLEAFIDEDYRPTKKEPIQQHQKQKKAVIYPSADTPKFDPRFKGWVKPDRIHTYKDAKGIVGYVCRYGSGKNKIVRPFYLSTKLAEGGKVETWSMGWVANPSPIYNYDLLAQNNKPVLLVEGEKCVDEVLNVFKLDGIDHPPIIPATWRGGAQGINKTDWNPLKNRKIFLWPDNDEAGQDTIKKLKNILPQIKVMAIPADAPKKWDVADFISDNFMDITSADLINFIARCLKNE